MLTLIPTSAWLAEASINFTATTVEAHITGAKVTVGRDVAIVANATVFTWSKDIAGCIGCIAICTDT